MVLADLLLGWMLYRIFGAGKPSPVAPPPQVSTTPSTTTAPASMPSPTAQVTPPPALLPAPETRPEPSFPVSQAVPTAAPTTAPAPGKKRAVEVWQVKRNLQTMIVGMVGQDVPGSAMAATLTSLEQSFPSGWEACRNVSAQEIATAKALLPRWRKGGVIFMGPATMAARRAYRMTEHPASSSQPAAIPVSASVSPAPKPPPPPVEVPLSTPQPTPAPTVVPVSYTAPVATPAPIVTPPPVTTPTAAPVAPAVPSMQVTTVRRGEGLAQIAKRCGQPESRDSVLAIREVNVPTGPDAGWKKTDLMKGGLAKLGRTGGIQPGDKLFVPPQWGIIDVSRL